MQRAKGFRPGAIQHAPAFTAGANEANIAQHAQMLGDGGLLQAQAEDDLADGTFLGREIVEDLTAARLGDGVEGIGSGGGARHGEGLYIPI